MINSFQNIITGLNKNVFIETASMKSKTTGNGNQFYRQLLRMFLMVAFFFFSLMEKTKRFRIFCSTAVFLKPISIARYSIRKLGNVSIIQNLSVFLAWF